MRPVTIWLVFAVNVTVPALLGFACLGWRTECRNCATHQQCTGRCHSTRKLELLHPKLAASVDH